MTTAQVVSMLWGDPMDIASRLLRNVITAGPGKTLYCADYSSIESRVLNWLAGEDWALDAYRSYDATHDAQFEMYRMNAAAIYGCSPSDIAKSDPRRQVGKTAELALGYQGGIAAFSVMATGYGVDLESLPALILPGAHEREIKKAGGAATLYLSRHKDAMSRDAAMSCDIIKQRWRESHPTVTRLWKQVQEAAQGAVNDPALVYNYRMVKFRKSGSYLCIQLPSKRVLYYYAPEIRPTTVETVDDEGNIKTWKTTALTFMGVDPTTKQWKRQHTHGGVLAENLVQAVSRDICATGMLNAEKAGYPVVLSVHDEVVSEAPEGFGSVEEYEKLLCQLPEWGVGLPMSAEGWQGKRYHK